MFGWRLCFGLWMWRRSSFVLDNRRLQARTSIPRQFSPCKLTVHWIRKGSWFPGGCRPWRLLRVFSDSMTGGGGSFRLALLASVKLLAGLGSEDRR